MYGTYDGVPLLCALTFTTLLCSLTSASSFNRTTSCRRASIWPARSTSSWCPRAQTSCRLQRMLENPCIVGIEESIGHGFSGTLCFSWGFVCMARSVYDAPLCCSLCCVLGGYCSASGSMFLWFSDPSWLGLPLLSHLFSSYGWRRMRWWLCCAGFLKETHMVQGHTSDAVRCVPLCEVVCVWLSAGFVFGCQLVFVCVSVGPCVCLNVRLSIFFCLS